MGRKPCASFLGYQNFQPRTAVSGANFELVPFEAPSIGRMPLGNPCWTLRALFAARFSECNFGSAAPLRGDLHFRCFARFYGLALCLAYVLDDGKVSSAHVLRASYPCAARPLWGTASALYRFMVSSTLDAARFPSTVAMASPKLCGASAFPLCRNLPNRCPAFSLVFLTACLDGTARSVPVRR